jgi:hypothetical protein
MKKKNTNKKKFTRSAVVLIVCTNVVFGIKASELGCVDTQNKFSRWNRNGQARDADQWKLQILIGTISS